MTKFKPLLAALALLSIVSALFSAEIFVINSVSRTLSRIDTQSGSVNNSFAQLGLTPNLMDMDAEHIYIACSGDNAIQVLDRASGALIRYIPVAASSNPYDVLKVGEFLYVTGLFTDRVYKICLQSNSVVGSLSVGVAPEGLCSDGNRLFVCNTGGYSSNYANSSVSVIDLLSFSVAETVPTWTNPQFAKIRGGYLHVSCTGNWSDLQGKLDIFDLNNLERIQRLNVGGNPGSLWISAAGTGYIGEGNGTALYSYDADSHTLQHGALNPLNYEASQVSGNSSLIALLKQNWASNSLVRLYGLDFTLLSTYEVGMASSDIMVAPENTSVEDDLIAAPRIAVYPNPLPIGTALRVESGAGGALEFLLYNVKGQLVQTRRLDKGENSFSLNGLPAGIYLYSVKLSGASQQGKLLITN